MIHICILTDAHTVSVYVSLLMQTYCFHIVTEFLQGDLDEEIFVQQPGGFCDNSNRVCELLNAMYGLKQSSRQWNSALNEALLKYGLKRSKVDTSVYMWNDTSTCSVYTVLCTRSCSLAWFESVL